MVDPTAPIDPVDPVEDAIPRDPEPIRRPHRRQYHPDSGMPDGLVAGFIGFGLGVITALAFKQYTDDDDDRDYRYRSRR